MSARLLIATALTVAIASSAIHGQSPTGKKPDPTAELIAKLRKPIDLDRSDEITLNDLAAMITQKFSITVFLDEAGFRSTDADTPPGSQTVKIPAVRGISLMTMLPNILAQADATFLVRRNHIEFVPIAIAGKETKNLAEGDDDAPPRLAQPLVSMIFKEKPLNEAVAELAEEYNLTVIVSPQSGDARTGFVSARLLNTPADKALELLALQCDLRVLPKANSFFITTRDHGNDLINEAMDRERSRIDLEKFRAAPPAPPQPAPPQIQVLPVQVPPPAPNPPGKP